MPPLIRSFLSRTVAALAAAATLAVAGCVGATDATAPHGAPETSRVALAASVGPVAQVNGAAVTLRVAVSYLRAAGDSVSLGSQTFALTDAPTQQLPVTVDIGGCLSDASRRGAELGGGANGVCILRLDLTLLQGGAVLDRAAVVPVLARPGQTTATDGQVLLYTVARVAIVPPAGTAADGGLVRAVVGQPITLGESATDATGQVVTSRAPVWTSDSPGVATVDPASGVITPRAPGRATITVTVGGRTATVVVNVAPAPAAVTVTVAGGLGSGAVTSLPVGIDCQVAAGVGSGTCSATFAGDAAVTLTATPATGSSFASWAGDCATAGAVLTCQLTPSVPRSAAVTFVAFRALGVTLAGNGDGAVTSQPAGIGCQLAAGPIGSTSGGTTSGACSAAYLDGSAVTLTAAPSATSSFGGWSGACASASLTCTVTLNQAQGVTATFVRRQATLTLAVGGSGAGTLTATGPGVLGNGACVLAAGAASTRCAIPVQVGSVVTITPTVGAASSFGGWAGACAGTTSAACSLTITADVSAGAVFTLLPVPLVVAPTVGNAGAGTVASADNAIVCAIGGATSNGSCTASIPVGAAVTLRATPAAGQVFLGWGGACAAAGTAGTCALTVAGGTTVTAAFAPPQALTLALSGTNGAGGRVTGASQACVLGGGAPSATCTPAGTFGTTVGLAATPDSASTFAGWTGACSGTAGCTVTLDQARTVGATFTRRHATVTHVLRGAGGGTVSLNGVPACTLVAGANLMTCPQTLDLYSTVTFTGAAAPGSTFLGWISCPSGAANGPCTFVVTGDVSVLAGFNTQSTTLSVAPASGNQGAGTVAFSNASCAIGSTTASGTCSTPINLGATITLTESPATGQVFLGWGGACASAGTATTCTVTVQQATTITVAFAPPQSLTLSLTGTGGGGGSVTGANQPCALTAGAPSASCALAQTYGSVVTFVATADSVSGFSGWTGACAGSGTAPTCAVTMNQARSVGAAFSRTDTYVTFSSIGLTACNAISFGYAVNGASTLVASKPAQTYPNCPTLSVADVTIRVPVTATVEAYLRDDHCSYTFRQSSTTHSSVTGSNPFQISINDGGQVCEHPPTFPIVPASGQGNLNVIQTFH